MANNENKTILQADLYENLLTEELGDYIGKLRITGTVRNGQIATRILERGSEFRKETIENILSMADQEKVKALAEGKSVIDGVGQFLLQLKGSFGGETASFDATKHSLVMGYTPGKPLRDALKAVAVQTNKATTGPVINLVTDASTGKTNESITSLMPLILSGANIKLVGEETDTVKAGVYFISATDETAATPAMLTVHNNPSELTVVSPTLADGQYYVEIRTRFANGSRLVKEQRTFRYPILLTVGTGGGGDDRPDIV